MKGVFVIHGLVEYVLAIIRSTVIDKKFLNFSQIYWFLNIYIFILYSKIILGGFMERRTFIAASLAAAAPAAMAQTTTNFGVDFSQIHWKASNQINAPEDGFLNIGNLATTGNTTVTDIYLNFASSGNSPSFQSSGYILTAKDRPTNPNYLPVYGTLLAIAAGNQVAAGNAVVVSYDLLIKYGKMELYCDISAKTLSGTCIAYWINPLHVQSEAFRTTLTFAP